MNEIAKINVNLKQGTVRDTLPMYEDIEGEFVLVPRENIQIESLDYRLVGETKGLISSNGKSLCFESLANHTELLKGEKYRFPFFIRNDSFETYDGSNVNIMAKLELIMKIDKDPKEGGGGLFSKIKNTLPWGKTFKKAGYLKFRSTHPQFEVRTTPSELVNSLSQNTKLLGIFFALLIFILAIFHNYAAQILVGVVIIGFTIAMYFMFAYFVLGSIQVFYDQEESNSFKAKIINQKNWNFSKEIFVHYEVREKVTDRRGTTDTSYTETIFSSNEQNIPNPKGELDLKFDIPNHLPGSNFFKDLRLFWVMIVTYKTTMGLSVKYEGIFTVKKLLKAKASKTALDPSEKA